MSCWICHAHAVVVVHVVVHVSCGSKGDNNDKSQPNHSGWVEAIMAAHLHNKQTDRVVIAGMTVSSRNSIIGGYHDFYGTLNARTDPFANNTILYGPTCNLSISLPPHIHSLPLFDERYREASWEDIEWCVRLRVHGGYTIAFCVHAVVEHEFHASVTGLYYMFRKYGRWQEITFDMHPGLREEFGRWLCLGK
eukprot:jgi/Chlat1/5342/Chrsp35S05269